MAERLIADTVAKQGIEPDSLTIHADRGSSMTSRPVAFLLSELGIIKRHPRPHTSNDSPYSEAGFKTLKYRPGFPDRFGSIEDARAFFTDFFAWYNTEHPHSGIALFTPADVHDGRTHRLARGPRQRARRCLRHPPRTFRQESTPPEAVPTEVWINRPGKVVPQA